MAKGKGSGKGGVLRRLRSKYRLLLIDDSTFKERLSLRLTRLNVILLAVLAFTIHGLFVTAVIVFTPLKRYIPGYADPHTRVHAVRATMKADSLEERAAMQDLYIANLRRILSGEVVADSASLQQLRTVTPGEADLAPTPRETALRDRVMQQEAYSVSGDGSTPRDGRDLAGTYFFPPVRGIVTSTFDRSTGHWGVDVVTRKDEAVKACQDGVVVLASWTTDGGHVLQVQHINDLVSIYKHNSVLLKKVGDRVKAGEAIAIVGDSGELTTGPHLHFELWYRGDAVDPQTYLDFK